MFARIVPPEEYGFNFLRGILITELRNYLIDFGLMTADGNKFSLPLIDKNTQSCAQLLDKALKLSQNAELSDRERSQQLFDEIRKALTFIGKEEQAKDKTKTREEIYASSPVMMRLDRVLRAVSDELSFADLMSLEEVPCSPLAHLQNEHFSYLPPEISNFKVAALKLDILVYSLLRKHNIDAVDKLSEVRTFQITLLADFYKHLSGDNSLTDEQRFNYFGLMALLIKHQIETEEYKNPLSYGWNWFGYGSLTWQLLDDLIPSELLDRRNKLDFTEKALRFFITLPTDLTEQFKALDNYVGKSNFGALLDLSQESEAKQAYLTSLALCLEQQFTSGRETVKRWL